MEKRKEPKRDNTNDKTHTHTNKFINFNTCNNITNATTTTTTTTTNDDNNDNDNNSNNNNNSEKAALSEEAARLKAEYLLLVLVLIKYCFQIIHIISTQMFFKIIQ